MRTEKEVIDGVFENVLIEEAAHACGICGGTLGIMGVLGRRAHFYCRNCGAWYSGIVGE